MAISITEIFPVFLYDNHKIITIFLGCDVYISKKEEI